MSTHEHADNYEVHAHPLPTKIMAGVLGALFFLTGLTVLAYNVRLGEWNLFVAIAIATIKALLVMGIFMHLHWDRPLNKVFFLSSFVFIGLFLGYTLNDTSHRGENASMTGRRIDPATGNFAFGTTQLIAEGGEFVAIPGLAAAVTEEPASVEDALRDAVDGADEAVGEVAVEAEAAVAGAVGEAAAGVEAGAEAVAAGAEAVEGAAEAAGAAAQEAAAAVVTP